MTLQQLIYFKEVAKVKHFTRAAENLYVAQSSLSHAVQELESELGAPLFLRRNGKKVEITNYGEALLPYVDRALEAVNDGKRHLMDMIAPERGVVNIAYTYLNGCSIIQEVEDTFFADGNHSDIQIRAIVNHGGLGFIEDKLALCEAELAISCTPFSSSRYVQAVKLCEQQLYAAVAAGSSYAQRNEISLHDLKDEPVIMFTGAYNLYDKVMQMFELENLKPQYVDGYTDWSTIPLAVARGKGVSILPKLDVNTTQVAYIPLSHPHAKRDVYLLWPTGHQISKAAETVKQYIIDYYKK